MIAAMLTRHFKTFKNQTYVPLIDNGNITGIVGLNGVGKSSILEALDCFFNDKAWNLHVSSIKSGAKENAVYIVPIFLIEKKEIPSKLQPIFTEIDKISKDMDSISKSINSSHKPLFEQYKKHYEYISRNYELNDFFIIPIGINSDGKIYTSFFNFKEIKLDIDINHTDKNELGYFDDDEEEEEPKKKSKTSEKSAHTEKLLIGVLDFIREKFDYVYIPKDITPEQYSQLENNEIQKLMGLTLDEELSKTITTSFVQNINSELNKFISKISDKLVEYNYRTPHNKQQNLKKHDLHRLIIKAFFSIRILHKKFETKWLPIHQLSTGEKAKALLELSEKLIHNPEKTSDRKLIFAIDEPEASLHISACFDQFDRLASISEKCAQIFFTSHWYGFMSMINFGSATVISKSSQKIIQNATEEDEFHNFDLIDLRYHREQIKQDSRSSKGILPHDIRLKSINDLIQAIVSSINIEKNVYNWIICEGSTERIYFHEYLIEHYKNKNLKIIPVGGASEVKKIYQYLRIALDEVPNINGKVILISDTDEQLVKYDVSDNKNLHCLRFVNNVSKKQTLLVKPNENPISPATCIEDILITVPFISTLKEICSDNDLIKIIEDAKIDDKEIGFSIDLKTSEAEKLKAFFSEPGIKYKFSKEYIKHYSPEKYGVPQLITQIHHLLNKK